MRARLRLKENDLKGRKREFGHALMLKRLLKKKQLSWDKWDIGWSNSLLMAGRGGEKKETEGEWGGITKDIICRPDS